MTERIEKLLEIVRTPKIKFSVEKATLFTEGYRAHEGEPDIVRMANAQAYLLDNINIFLLPGDLIAGCPASQPMSIEADFWTKGTWQPEGIESLRREEYAITDQQAAKMYELTDYWRRIIPEYKLYELYDKPMWAWKHSGYLLPRNSNLEEAAGMGYACCGMAILPESESYQFDYGYVINKGLQAIIDESRAELERVSVSLDIRNDEDVEKIYVLRAFIIINEAVIRWAGRYADMCDRLAGECRDEDRKVELRSMAEACRRVPAQPARTFREALQFHVFIYLMTSCQTTAPLGRGDQYLYPFYRADVEAGRIDDETVLEYLQCYRLKIMQMKNTSGGQSRLKWSGQARWNGVTIGGVDREGNDASNELTYLFLEAAMRCQTPHHTLHFRVHKNTPKPLMDKAIELVKTGIGMPSFVSDDCYIGNLVLKDVPLEVARDYYIMGCVDPTVPEGFGHVFSMMVTSLPFDTFLHDGYSPLLGCQVGPHTGDVREMDFETFKEKLIEHEKYYMRYFAQDMLLRYLTCKNTLEDPFSVSLFHDAVSVGRPGKKRPLPYGLGPTLNVGVGTINVCDSVCSIKKLVYDDKTVTMDELIAALDANWEGERNQEIRRLCLDVPKYGNNVDWVDDLTAEIYERIMDAGCSLEHYRGGKYNVAGISITSHDPGGAITGATPDGRLSGSYLADGAASPSQGKDTHGPTAMFMSAMKIPQVKMQSMLLNMKFHPSALKTPEDVAKLGALISTYLCNGGKQVQFNVIDPETLKKAKADPDSYRDLVVRVAGYSAYFVSLSGRVQDEIIMRTVHELK